MKQTILLGRTENPIIQIAMLSLKIVSACAIVATTALAQQPDGPPPGAREFVQGQQAVMRRNETKAIEAFRQALDLNPSLDMAHYYLGFAYEAQENWELAAQHFEDFLRDVRKGHPSAAPLIQHATRQGGMALARTMTSRRAIPYLQLSLQDEPDDADLHFHLGMSHYQNRDLEAATLSLDQALALDDQLHEARYYRGLVALSSGDLAGAESLLQDYVDSARTTAVTGEALFRLGSIAETMGDIDKAIKHYERFVTLVPTHPRAGPTREKMLSLSSSQAPAE